ncbi:SDR family NAD(P)-dependent oxidoreductase [Melaminivora suipulveris]|nr:SDR family oxidoreductase [Melaminivora suipulveris]
MGRMDLGLKNKLALVSGADSGIGFHTTLRLLREGATVVMTDQYPNRLDCAIEQAREVSRQVHAFVADLTRPRDVQRLHQRVCAEVGHIDILVQCAGITGATGPFHESTDEGWSHTIETNLLGPVRLVRAFLASLRRGGWGRIVLIASEDAVQPYDEELPYCASKAGILSFGKGLSRSYAQDGLLVNCVSPAFIHTPMTDAMMDKRAAERGTSVDEAIASFLQEERPYMELGRRGRPEEVANVIAFLCSEAASFVNGANYRVDSGSVATM